MVKIDKMFFRNLIRYLLTGGTAFILDYALFYFIVIIFGDEYKLLGNSVGLICGFTYTFILNKYWTFNSKGYAGKQLIYNILLLGINTVITNFLLLIWCDYIGLAPIMGKIINTALTVSWNFFIYKYFIFK